MEDDPDTEEVIHDKKGKNGAPRIAVSVKDTVHLSNIFDVTREVQVKGKEEKNWSDVQLAAKKKETFQNHDSSLAESSAGLASAMVRASGSGTSGNAFSGHTMDVSLKHVFWGGQRFACDCRPSDIFIFQFTHLFFHIGAVIRMKFQNQPMRLRKWTVKQPPRRRKLQSLQARGGRQRGLIEIQPLRPKPGKKPHSFAL